MAVATLAGLKTYLGPAATPWSDPVLTSALATELAAQAAKLKTFTDATRPEDVVEASYRRVARNLALRGLPLGFSASMAEAAVAITRIGDDVEIRRLEAPHRKIGPFG